MTLVHTTDENGDEVLECEKDSRGQYVWNPSPEVFVQYRANEARDAVSNLLHRLLIANPSEAIHARTLVVRGQPGRGYLSYFRQSGGVPDEEHAHTRATMAHATSVLRGNGR